MPFFMVTDCSAKDYIVCLTTETNTTYRSSILSTFAVVHFSKMAICDGDPMNRVDGKVAIVTGGGSGIGRASSRLLSEAGAEVVVTDIDGDAADETVAEIADAGGSAVAIQHDVTSEAAWETVIAATLENFGSFHVLVNNAGVGGGAQLFEDTPFEMWRQVMSVNLDGVFLGTQQAVKVMRQAGGSIVNISSIMGMVGGANAAYNASKGGVRLLTKSVAVYCGSNGLPIRVNSIHPGYIWTPMIEKIASYIPGGTEQDVRDLLTPRHPIGRLGEPIDVAKGVLFLASDDSSFMTGSELVIDGGYTAV